MEDCAERRTRPKIKNQHQKQKRRRDQVKSIIAAYVSGKVPLSKMMNPSRLTAPKNRNSEGDTRKAERSADPPKTTIGVATSRHKRKSGTTGAADASLAEQKGSAVGHPELEKLWPVVQTSDQFVDSLLSCKDGCVAEGRDLQMCSSCSKAFSKDASTASSKLSLVEMASETTLNLVDSATGSFEIAAEAATPPSRIGHSEEPTQRGSTPRKRASLAAPSLEQSTPTLFDLYPFDYDSFACYLTKKCPPSRHSAGPSLRWRTTSANFTKRQNLLELIKSHENVEQCLVKQIIHLRRERDKYRHAYVDLVKIHKILANRWFQFKKINID